MVTNIILDAIPDFVNLKDGEGRWLFANQAAIRFFKMQDGIYSGKTDIELEPYCSLSYDELLYCITTDEASWLNRKETRFEETFVQPDGTTRTFDVIKIPMFHDNGERNCLLVIGRDITTRKQAEQVIEKAQTINIIGELAAGVAHEIRNPLTSLKGFTQLLQKHTNDGKKYAEIMMAELSRIEEIISEFLMLAKPQNVNYQMEDVRAIVNKTVTLLNPHAILKNVEIEVQSESIPNMECVPNHLKQVFINVLKNAIDSMDSGGIVTIHIKSDGKSEISISFIDRGYGIPEEKISKLGQPFYTTKEKGTGLGLMVSYSIIKNHQGRIQIESKVGQGTTFTMIFPVRQSKNIRCHL
ncbi:ATP-binding protein [Aneurinibacillus terranovensis]|uniref:ATP-binding protein n=1 Tax=Aneurinibacillus terranovensis TaxID=278991 RepID=UPI00042493D6|nr:ATP-binding protein [Aneurinibacillus terranovensis]